MKTLYEITGRITDANTLLVQKSEFDALRADNERLSGELDVVKQQEPAGTIAFYHHGASRFEPWPFSPYFDNAIGHAVVYLAAGAQPVYAAAGAAPVPLATISSAPGVLNTNDKAMWVTGWNECREAMLEASPKEPS